MVGDVEGDDVRVAALGFDLGAQVSAAGAGGDARAGPGEGANWAPRPPDAPVTRATAPTNRSDSHDRSDCAVESTASLDAPRVDESETAMT